MEKLIQQKIDTCVTLPNKLELLDEIKNIVDRLYSKYESQLLTTSDKLEYINKLKEMKIFSDKLKWSSSEAVNELIEFMKSYEVTYYKSEETIVSSCDETEKRFKFNENTEYYSSVLSSEIRNDELVTIGRGELEFFHYMNHDGYYDYINIEEEIKKLNFKHVSVDDFIYFLIIITDSEYIMAYECDRKDGRKS